MKIAYVSDTFVPETNGIATAIVRHSRGLLERGHDVLIVCPRYRREHPPTHADLLVERLPSVRTPSNPETRFSLVTPRQVERLLRRFDPDIVHVHTPLSLGICGILAARRLGVPLVQTYHSYVPGFSQYASPARLLGLARGPMRINDSGRFAWWYTHRLYNPSDMVLAPSETLCQLLRDNGVTPPVRYQTNGIDGDEFPPKSDWHLRRRIMHAGRLGYEKHAEVVVEAFARFAGGDESWELHLLGEGPAEPYLRSLISRLGLDGQVRFEGFVDRGQLAHSYAEADVYATASTIETQGLVVLEAMASGTPVVGVDALAVPEMSRDGRSGIIVAPYDAEAMSRAFQMLATDHALRERMGRAALEDVKPHGLEAAIDRLEGTYEELAASRRAH